MASLLSNLESGSEKTRAFLGLVTPEAPRRDPTEALMDMRLRPDLRDLIKPLLAKHGASVEEAVIKDPYGGSLVRHYTAIHHAGGERGALLSMPSWVLGDGNHVASVEAVRYLFRDKSIRLIAENLDAPWLGFDKRLAAWKAQDRIDGQFVPWSYIARALEGAHDIAQVLQIDLDDSGGVPMPSKKKLRIFMSYAHEDEALMKELVKHLSILKSQGLIEAWHDRKIGAGREWAGAIDENLNSAEIILLLVSADFVASEYCSDVELARAMQRHEAKTARVIPVILRKVDWTKAVFAKLQALPTDGKPIKSWEDTDEALADVALGIRQAVEEIVGKN